MPMPIAISPLNVICLYRETGPFLQHDKRRENASSTTARHGTLLQRDAMSEGERAGATPRSRLIVFNPASVRSDGLLKFGADLESACAPLRRPAWIHSHGYVPAGGESLKARARSQSRRERRRGDLRASCPPPIGKFATSRLIVTELVSMARKSAGEAAAKAWLKYL